MRRLMLQKPYAHPVEYVQCLVNLRAAPAQVERQQKLAPIRLQRLADDQRIRLCGELPVDIPHPVTRAVFAHIVYLRKAAAGLRAIGPRLKTAQIRKRLRLLLPWQDVYASKRRKLHPEGEQTEIVRQTGLCEGKVVSAAMRRIEPDIAIVPRREGVALHIAASCQTVGTDELKAAWKRRHMRRALIYEPDAAFLTAQALRRKLRGKLLAQQRRQAAKQRQKRQAEREDQQKPRDPAGIKGMEKDQADQKRRVKKPVFEHGQILGAVVVDCICSRTLSGVIPFASASGVISRRCATVLTKTA